MLAQHWCRALLSQSGRTDTGSFLTGPYLMTPKTNGMVVVWELDKPMKSTITYGTSDADKKTLEVPVEEGEKFKGESMHMYRARLTDLTPGTTYTYKVETEDGQTMDGHFRCPKIRMRSALWLSATAIALKRQPKVSDVITVRSGLYPAYRRYGRGHRLSEGSVPFYWFQNVGSFLQCARSSTTAATTITVSTLT